MFYFWYVLWLWLFFIFLLFTLFFDSKKTNKIFIRFMQMNSFQLCYRVPFTGKPDGNFNSIFELFFFWYFLKWWLLSSFGWKKKGKIQIFSWIVYNTLKNVRILNKQLHFNMYKKEDEKSFLFSFQYLWMFRDFYPFEMIGVAILSNIYYSIVVIMCNILLQ